MNIRLRPMAVTVQREGLMPRIFQVACSKRKHENGSTSLWVWSSSGGVVLKSRVMVTDAKNGSTLRVHLRTLARELAEELMIHSEMGVE